MQASRWSGTFRVAERNHRLRNAFGITVVTRELHHEGLGTKAKSLRDRFTIGFGVGYPACREGGEVGVFAEDGLGADILLELHQVAGVADQHIE